MSGFICIVDKNGKRHCLNARYIEEIAEVDEKSCCIYMAFVCPHANEQDYIEVEISYDSVVDLIEWRCGQ